MDGEIRVSANKLNIFLSCRNKLYMYLNNYPIGDVDTKYIDLGNAVHGYIEDRMKSIEKDPEWYFTENNVVPEFKEAFDKCIENAQPYMKYVGKAVPEKVILKHFVTPKGRKVALDARIDLVTDDGIYDWKTSSKLDKQEYRLQGMVYHFATDFTYPKVTFVKMKDGETMDIPAPPADFIPKLVDRYIDCIEEKDRKPSPNRLCDNCDYTDICRGELQYVYIEDLKADPEKYGLHSRWKK